MWDVKCEMFLFQIEFQVLHHSYYYHRHHHHRQTSKSVIVSISNYIRLWYPTHIPWSFRFSITIALWLFCTFDDIFFWIMCSSSFIFGRFNFNLYQCVSRKMFACISIMLTCFGMFACCFFSRNTKTKHIPSQMLDSPFSTWMRKTKEKHNIGNRNCIGTKSVILINEWSEWENNKTMTNKSWSSNIHVYDDFKWKTKCLLCYFPLVWLSHLRFFILLFFLPTQEHWTYIRMVEPNIYAQCSVMFSSISSQRGRWEQYTAIMCVCVCVFFPKRNVCTLIFLFPSFNFLRCFFFMIKRKICSLKANVTPVLHIMDAFNVPSFMLCTHPLSFESIGSCSDLSGLLYTVHITNEMNALFMQQKPFILCFVLKFFHIRWL